MSLQNRRTLLLGAATSLGLASLPGRALAQTFDGFDDDRLYQDGNGQLYRRRGGQYVPYNGRVSNGRPVPDSQTDLDAEAMIRNLRSAPLLYGYRGSEPVDVDVLQDIIMRLAAMKDDLPEIAELDLEPVSVNADGYTALSARAKVTPSGDRRGEWYVRRLSQPASLGDTLA